MGGAAGPKLDVAIQEKVLRKIVRVARPPTGAVVPPGHRSDGVGASPKQPRDGWIRGTLEHSYISNVSHSNPIPKEPTMDREHVKGAADKAKGTIKDVAGKITDDKKLQAEGKIDKAKGAAHNAVGDVKDAVRKAGE